MLYRGLLNPDELYESVVVFYRDEAERKHNEAMKKAKTLPEKNALLQAYKDRLKPINESHLRIWHDATIYNKCFHFPHPYITVIKGKKGKELLAEALQEDPWWVIHELSHYKLDYVHPHCGTEGCMNPLHWTPKNIRGTDVIPNIPGLLMFYPELKDKLHRQQLDAKKAAKKKG